MIYELKIYENGNVVEVQTAETGEEILKLIDPANKAYNGKQFEIWRDHKVLVHSGVLDF